MSSRICLLGIQGLDLIQRCGTAFQSTIASDNIEMDGSPIGEKDALVSGAIVGFEISIAGFAVIDTKRALFLDS